MQDSIKMQNTKYGNFMSNAHSVVIISLLFFSQFLYSFKKIDGDGGKSNANHFFSPIAPSHNHESIAYYTENKDTAKPAYNDPPGNVSKEEFKKKALSKIKTFQNCLYILCDKNAGQEAQDNAIDQAASLFVDGAIIEVSSIHSDVKKHLKVRDFLEKLRNLRYEKIQITFSHVDYVSNIRKGADGKYYGVVSFEQTFRAYSDGRLVYEDETKKTTEVQLIVYEKNYHGDSIQQWDVMLSDVEVLGTKSPKQ